MPAFPQRNAGRDEMRRAQRLGHVAAQSEPLQNPARIIGPDARLITQPPHHGDYLFIHPTRTSPLALAAWAVIPNIQFFWLVDAVTQHQDIPAPHLLLLVLYSLTQVGIFLSIAVLLFQNREVG